MKALYMRNEDDIYSAHDMKSICRAALLNDNAPDSELYRTEFVSQRSSNFCSLQLDGEAGGNDKFVNKTLQQNINPENFLL